MKIINDLYDYEPKKIVQDSDVFKFSLDSILLAEFVTGVKPNDKILDVCTGNGVIPLILSNYFPNKIVAFEIQEYIATLAQESLKLNNLEDQIQVIQDDVKIIHKYFPGNNFDIVIANPPYFKYKESSLINENREKAIARHEIHLQLEDLFRIVFYALKEYGTFYLVHIPERLEEILYLCEKYHIIAKQIQFIYTKDDKEASMVLLKCVKNGKNGVKVRNPLYINNYNSYKNIFRR